MTKPQTKKTVFSGIQPSGNLHIGNYLGAITQWVEMQDDYNCIFCVVDLHAITVKQDPKFLKKKITEIAKIYLASGINPKKASIFRQSDIGAHCELAWILNCVARMADLDKMTQYKEKADQAQETASVGLFDYPVLMAADILLYNTDAVPVGDDQLQHVELTRELGKRFNKQFGLTFKIPEARILKEGARIMGLDDPAKKMSKSAASAYNFIALTDKPDEAAKKIMKAVTDSGSEIKFDKEKKPALANLLTIYSLLADEPIKNLEKKYIGQGYGAFKKDLAEVARSFLKDFQGKYNNISDSDIWNIIKSGAENIRPIAEETLRRAKERMGVL
jgi:tryptophanyl-tRNA synthetase